MDTVTIPKKEYRNLIRRQERVEEELDILKKVVRWEIEERQIKPSVLKLWGRISRDLDRGKGRVFESVGEMRRWLKQL